LASKGYADQAERKKQELIDALLRASRGGLDSIYCDTGPCTLRLIQDGLDGRLKLHDPVKSFREQLLDRRQITPQDKPVAVHVTCSAQHPGEAQGLIDIVLRCTSEVVIPELSDHALRSLKSAVQYCEEGISTRRTCEIGLSQHGWY
jgi:D-lactate dehydrogenase